LSPECKLSVVSAAHVSRRGERVVTTTRHSGAGLVEPVSREQGSIVRHSQVNTRAVYTIHSLFLSIGYKVSKPVAPLYLLWQV